MMVGLFSSSPETVLMRFLFLLSTHEWEAEPLIVNLNNELSGQGLTPQTVVIDELYKYA